MENKTKVNGILKTPTPDYVQKLHLPKQLILRLEKSYINLSSEDIKYEKHSDHSDYKEHTDHYTDRG